MYLLAVGSSIKELNSPFFHNYSPQLQRKSAILNGSNVDSGNPLHQVLGAH
jgi:hypothetical protein